jgi:hypothetical protein
LENCQSARARRFTVKLIGEDASADLRLGSLFLSELELLK